MLITLTHLRNPCVELFFFFFYGEKKTTTTVGLKETFIEVVLTSNHNIMFQAEIRKKSLYVPL